MTFRIKPFTMSTMAKLARLKRDAFKEILAENLMTPNDLAYKIGANKSYFSRISSGSKSSTHCGVKFVNRILKGFNNKYVFDDLFYWEEKENV